MFEEYGLKGWLEEKIDVENFKLGLQILANAKIDSGCKAEIAKIKAKIDAKFGNAVQAKALICVVNVPIFLANC
jgi:hypothetical protein